jgi:DNA-binding MarR family transcriptional regulator
MPEHEPRKDAAGGAGALARIDAALLGLRHLWAGPPARQAAGADGVELSTVWIVDALVRAEQAGPGSAELTVRELAEALDVAHSTASRLLDRAVAAGMVARRRSAQDGRAVTCTLTPAGRSLAEESRAFRLAYLTALTADWSAAERAAFADLLGRFAEAVGGRPPAPPDHPHREDTP